MRPVRFLLLGLGVLTIVLLGAKVAVAQPLRAQYGGPGGGAIVGYVLGFDMYDQLQPVAWASVYADDGQYKFVAYTGGSGYYEMFVPTGTYNVTVVEPGYLAYSQVIAVSNGSASTINFYLEESHVPIPEFPSGVVQALAVVTLAGALFAMRRTRRRSK